MITSAERPEPRSTFRNKYLTVLIAAMALFSISVYGQGDAGKYSTISGYGFKYKRIASDSVFIIPLSTSTHIPYRSGGLRYNSTDSTLEYWTGFQWIKTNSALGVQTLQQVLNSGSVLTENETILLHDSLAFASGKVLAENLRVTNAQTATDTTTHKPAALDANGNLVKFNQWTTSANLQKVTDNGNKTTDTIIAGFLKLDSLDVVSDTTAYKPSVLDANGNLFKFNRWPGVGNFAPLTSVDTTLKFVPLVVFLGESNAAGVIANSGLSGSELAAFPRIQILNNNNFQLQSLQIGVNNNININSALTNHGMELQLMKNVQSDSAFLWDTVYLVKIARAGATIASLIDSLPTAFRRLDSATKHIRSLGYYPQIYVFSSQGINDGAADSATWLKNTEYYLSELRKRYGYFPVYYTKLIGAGVNRNNTIARLPYWDGFLYEVNTDGLTTQDANHWDSTGIAEICKRMLRLSYDTVQERDLYIQTQANKIKRGYTSFTLLNVDSDADINGNALFGGNVQLDADNKALTLAGGTIGMIKQFGTPGFFAMADGQPLSFKRSNQTVNISAADTYTEILTVNTANELTISGGINTAGSISMTADNTSLTPFGGHIGIIKKVGGPGFMGVASGQLFIIKRSDQTSGISAAGTYTDIFTIDVDNNITQTATGYMKIASGTTAQRPGSPSAAMIRNNTTDNTLEWYNGSTWVQPATGSTLYSGDGSLAGNRVVTGAANSLTFTSTRTGANATMNINNTSTGGGLIISASGSGIGIEAGSSTGYGGNIFSTSGPGLQVSSSSNTGLIVSSTTGVPAEIQTTPASTNTTVALVSGYRKTSGTAAANIAGAFDMYNENAGGSDVLSTRLISKLTTATASSEVSQFEIWGVNTGTSAQRFTLKGTGQFQLNNYGTQTFTGTPASYLQVTSSGDVIEKIAPKEYTSLLTQSGTSAPTAIVLGTNTVGAIAWARTSAGVYTGTLSGAFTVDKTWLNAHLSDQSGGTVIIVKLVRTDANTVTLTSLNSSLVATDAFTQISLEIKVYP